MNLDELLALDALDLLDEHELAALEAAEISARDRAEVELVASALALAVEPIDPPPALRERLLAELGGRERLAPFVDRLAALFDLAHERARSILALFDQPEGWTTMYPGAAYFDLEGGPALGGATAGLVRIAAGLEFPHHRHIGEERVFVLQGAFVDDAGNRVCAGQQAVMADGSAHAFTAEPGQELLYAVVVGEIEFADGTRAPHKP